MTTYVAVAVAAASASTGHQDITTTDLGGATPVAVLFTYSRGASDGSITTHGQVAYGACDGTNQIATANMFVNGTPGSNYAGINVTNACIIGIKDQSTIHSRAAFVGFITNGVTVDWSVAAADGWLVTALFFAGTDWTATVGTFLNAPSPGTSVALGYEPNCVFVMEGGIWTFDGTLYGGTQRPCFGWTAWPGATVQECLTTDTAANFSGIIDNSCATWHATIYRANVQLFQAANGFTAIETLAVGGRYSGYLALKYTGPGTITGGVITINSTASTQSFSGFGGQPGGFLIFQQQEQRSAFTPPYRFGATFNTPTKSGGWAIGGNPLSSPYLIKNVVCEDTITMLHWDGTKNLEGTITSYDSNGITISFSTPPSFLPAQGGLEYWRWAWLAIVNYVETPPLPRKIFAWVSD